MDKEYKDKFAISNSALKDWREMCPQKWKEIWIDKTRQKAPRPATTSGSYLDCICFTPKHTDKRFVEATVGLPSPKVTLILNELFQRITELNKNREELKEKNTDTNIPVKEYDLEDKDLIISLCEKHDHWAGKGDRGYNDVKTKGTEYFNFLKSVGNKTVISPEDVKKCKELKEILYTHPISKGFFSPKKDCQVIFQQKLFVEHELEGLENLDFIPLKGMTDIIHFNHNLEQVREVDLKKTEDAFLFIDSVKRFGYVRQHSFYNYLIEIWLKSYQNGKYAHYSIAPPLNLVIDEDMKTPYIYTYNTIDLQIERHGMENTKIKGWEKEINEIAYHIDTQKWSHPIEHLKNNQIYINWYKR